MRHGICGSRDFQDSRRMPESFDSANVWSIQRSLGTTTTVTLAVQGSMSATSVQGLCSYSTATACFVSFRWAFPPSRCAQRCYGTHWNVERRSGKTDKERKMRERESERQGSKVEKDEKQVVYVSLALKRNTFCGSVMRSFCFWLISILAWSVQRAKNNPFPQTHRRGHKANDGKCKCRATGGEIFFS